MKRTVIALAAAGLMMALAAPASAQGRSPLSPKVRGYAGFGGAVGIGIGDYGR